MEFNKLVGLRYSCRSFLNKKIEHELLSSIFEIVRKAPSARNIQPWHFIVIDETELLQKIKATYGREWINSAPAIIVACVNHQKAWRRADGKSSAETDISIAVTHLIMAATNTGLATCWVAKFNAMQCAEILKLPEGVEPAALIPIGYARNKPNESRFDNQRKPVAEILSFNKYPL